MPINQTVIQNITKAIQQNQADIIISLINKMPTDERNELCDTQLEGYQGVTFIMAMSVMMPTLGLAPLRTLTYGLRDGRLNEEQRVFPFHKTIPEISNQDNTELTYRLKKNQGQSSAQLLIQFNSNLGNSKGSVSFTENQEKNDEKEAKFHQGHEKARGKIKEFDWWIVDDVGINDDGQDIYILQALRLIRVEALRPFTIY